MKTVGILGSGPAGLMAAHAVGLCGRPLSVHSRPEKSVLGGAQYLHHPVPYLTLPEPDRTITNKLLGTPEGYRSKVYGNDPHLVPQHVSAMDVTDGEIIGVWDLNSAYDLLWEWFEKAVNQANITADWIEEHGNEFELIVSSVPAPAICKKRDTHRFIYQEVWVDASVPTFIPEDTIVYNGDKEPSWYRASNIGGAAGGVEWSVNGPKPPIPNLRLIKKPLRHTCDCWPDILRVGRYGTWSKGVLTHDAFYEVGRTLMGSSKDVDVTSHE